MTHTSSFTRMSADAHSMYSSHLADLVGVLHAQTYFVSVCVFFFQAEDGIRDIGVTGVQTCALPIYLPGQSGMLRYASWVFLQLASNGSWWTWFPWSMFRLLQGRTAFLRPVSPAVTAPSQEPRERGSHQTRSRPRTRWRRRTASTPAVPGPRSPPIRGCRPRRECAARAPSDSCW